MAGYSQSLEAESTLSQVQRCGRIETAVASCKELDVGVGTDEGETGHVCMRFVCVAFERRLFGCGL